MSYRCEPCGTSVPAGRPRLTHSVVRTGGPLRGTLLREVAVCSHCKGLLDMGVPLRDIHRKEYRKPVKVKSHLHAAVPPVPRDPAARSASPRAPRSEPIPSLTELLGARQPPPRPKSWKRVAVWGDPKTRVEAGVIGAFSSVEQAEAACSRFRKQFGADPAVDAWVRPQN
jgi:hypothetical protein